MNSWNLFHCSILTLITSNVNKDNEYIKIYNGNKDINEKNIKLFKENEEILFKIYRSKNLYKLKNHCRDWQNGNIENCIFNYNLYNDYAEVEAQKNYRYITL